MPMAAPFSDNPGDAADPRRIRDQAFLTLVAYYFAGQM